MGRNRNEFNITARPKSKNSYEARVTINGVQKSVSGKNAKEAIRKARNLIIDSEKGVCIKKDKITVGDWLNRFLVECELPNVQPRTYENYSHYNNYIQKSFIATIKLQELKREDVQKFIVELKETRKKDGKVIATKSVKETYSLLKRGLKEAISRDMLFKNVADNITLPKNDEKEEVFLTLEEEREWLAIIENNPQYFWLEFLLLTGLRSGELCGLQWQDIDFENKIISVKRAFGEIPIYDNNGVRTGKERKLVKLKTQNSTRHVPLVDRLYIKLLKYKPVNVKPDDFVFYSDEGKALIPGNLKNRLERFIKKYNLKKISIHKTRHTFTTRCAEIGLDLKATQGILGHSDISTTADIYMHFTKEQVINATKELNKLRL